MRFVSLPRITEADFDFYGNDVQMFAVPAQEPNEADEWGDVDADAVPVNPAQLGAADVAPVNPAQLGDAAAVQENGPKQVNEQPGKYLTPYERLVGKVGQPPHYRTLALTWK
jgi:hypothetical protein